MADQLFHFVGNNHAQDHEQNYKILCSILTDHRIAYPPRTDPGWGLTTIQFYPSESLKRGELMVSNVTCFCDIALEDCAIHTQKYGQFGLGFDRAFLIKLATRPVMCIPYDPTDHLSIYGKTLVRDILAMYESYDKLVVQKLMPDES